MNFLDRFLTKTLEIVLVVLFSSSLVLYLFQISMRYLFQISFLWISPLIQYFFIVTAFYGGALAVRSGENIKIDLLKSLIKKKWIQIVVNGISALITFLIILIFFQHTIRSYLLKMTSEINLPLWVMDLPLVFLFCCSFFYYFQNLKILLSEK